MVNTRSKRGALLPLNNNINNVGRRTRAQPSTLTSSNQTISNSTNVTTGPPLSTPNWNNQQEMTPVEHLWSLPTPRMLSVNHSSPIPPISVPTTSDIEVPPFEVFTFNTGRGENLRKRWSSAPAIPRSSTPSFTLFPDPPNIGTPNSTSYVPANAHRDSANYEKELRDIEEAIKQNQGALPKSAVGDQSCLTTYMVRVNHPKLMDSLDRLKRVNKSLREVHNRHNVLSSAVRAGFNKQGAWNQAMEQHVGDTDSIARGAIDLVTELTHKSN